MASISVFTDQENSEVQGLAAKNSNRPVGDVLARSLDKMSFKKTPATLSRFESTRSALGDVSNSCSRPASLIVGKGKDNYRNSVKPKLSGKSTLKKPSDDEPPVPRRRILSSQIVNTHQNPVTGENFKESDIEIMPPNDADYPDNLDDVWPIAERPTREELKWLTKFYFAVGHKDKPDDCDDVDFDDCCWLPSVDFNVLPADRNPDNLENLLAPQHGCYEQEIAKELPLEDITYTGFILK